jgi:hypothetical protein
MKGCAVSSAVLAHAGTFTVAAKSARALQKAALAALTATAATKSAACMFLETAHAERRPTSIASIAARQTRRRSVLHGNLATYVATNRRVEGDQSPEMTRGIVGKTNPPLHKELKHTQCAPKKDMTLYRRSIQLC